MTKPNTPTANKRTRKKEQTIAPSTKAYEGTAGEKSKGGRPTKYRPEYAEQAEKLAKLGATDFQVADFFGAHLATIHRWAARHDDHLRTPNPRREMARS